MAKKMMKMESFDSSLGMSTCGPKCVIMGLVGAAFGALGLWLIIGGAMGQWNNTMSWTNTWLWYFGGFLFLGFCKVCKMKACNACRM